MYWTALIMGITGSLHCAGMCSPLALAATANGKAMRNRAIYNAGRVLTYAILGLLLGALGSLVPFNHFRNVLTAALGISLLILACLGMTSVRVPFIHPMLSKVVVRLKSIFSVVLQHRSPSAMFLLGMLNGILPCGLTFAALLVALSVGPWNAALFMMVFGLGTLPVMLGFTGGLHYVVKRFNVSLPKMAAILLFVSGCLLLTRVVVHQHDAAAAGHDHSLVDTVLCR